jgi:hypothetical protein
MCGSRASCVASLTIRRVGARVYRTAKVPMGSTIPQRERPWEFAVPEIQLSSSWTPNMAETPTTWHPSATVAASDAARSSGSWLPKNAAMISCGSSPPSFFTSVRYAWRAASTVSVSSDLPTAMCTRELGSLVAARARSPRAPVLAFMP